MACLLATQSGQGAPSGIVDRLTPDTRQEAMQCGRAGADCAVRPYELCPATNPYPAALVTPFSRVASAALEAGRDGSVPRRMELATLNRWGVAIYVQPGDGPAKIASVELRRDGAVISPRTSTTGPITVVRTDGSTHQAARGYFAFQAAAFAPTADVTVVLNGSAGEVLCTLDRRRLASLR